MRTAEASPMHATQGVAGAVWHALLWLVAGNAIGVLLAVLLLVPSINPWLGAWTYGRWMMVHMNVALYGWCSLPMAAFLFKVYGADRGSLGAWCRSVLWLWSGALVVGSASWLSGHSSGKLFLDWSGFARVFFPFAMMGLWLLLAVAFVREARLAGGGLDAARIAKLAGLVVLLAVPLAIYFASDPTIYPAINPDTGGPTGESQLESSLAIVLIALMLPFGLTHRIATRTRIVAGSWILLVAEAALCSFLNRGDVSHHQPAQFLSLGVVVLWLPIMPIYYGAFAWHAETRRWRTAFLWWWGGLVVSGWLFFLPGVLDRFKFTDGLVGHSLTAVAGFVTALLIFVMVQLIGEEDAWIFNRQWSFHAWNMGVLAYVLVMTAAGWIESANPAFTIAPGAGRNTLYILRLLTGIAMLAASMEWLIAASSLPAISVNHLIETKGAKVAA